jgi:membrane protein DedA with SNARE-associated domain
VQQILDFVRENHSVWTLVVLFIAAALEYMVPPLPADSVVLAGSLLVVAGSWSFATVFFVAVAGGFCGATIHFVLGHQLALPNGTIRGQRHIERLSGRGSFDRFIERFRRHGMLVIVLNRMFPGIRSVTFIAAGASRLPFPKTMFFGLISNMGWTLALLLLGTSLGGNWEKIQAAFAVYSRVLAIGTGCLVGGYVLYKVFKIIRRRARRTE